MMGYKFWVDCKLSGSESHDQILELTVNIESPDRICIDSYSKNLRLRPGLKPSPIFLAKNKLNPLSKDWEKQSITEWVMAHELKKLCQKYTLNGVKPIFISFNDDTFNKIKNVFELCSIDISDFFNNSVMTMNKTAINLINNGLINLMDNDEVSLQSIAKSIGTFKLSKKDSDLLYLTSHALFELATFTSYNKLNASPENFKINETYDIISNSYSSGLSKRTILIIENLNSKIIAYDFLKNKIICLNYATIIHANKTSDSDNYLNYISNEDIQKASNNLFKKEKNETELKLIKEIEYKISNSFSVKEVIPELEKMLQSKGYSDADIIKIMSKAINRSAIQGKYNSLELRNINIINKEFQELIKNTKVSIKFISKLISDWENYFHQKIQINENITTNNKESEVFYNLSAINEKISNNIIYKNPTTSIWNTKLIVNIYNSESTETYEKTFYFYEYLTKVQFKSAKLLTCEFNNKELPIEILSSKEFLVITKDSPLKLEWNHDNTIGESINLILYRESISPLNNSEITIQNDIDSNSKKEISNFLFSEETLSSDSLESSIKDISIFLNKNNNFIKNQIKLLKDPQYLLSLKWNILSDINLEPNSYYLIKTVTNKINKITFIKLINITESSILYNNMTLNEENKHNLSSSLLKLLSEESLDISKIYQIIKL